MDEEAPSHIFQKEQNKRGNRRCQKELRNESNEMHDTMNKEVAI